MDGDKKVAGEPLTAGVSAPSKRVKTNNGEQISIIVQECLKSITSLLFAKEDGACCEERERGGDTLGNQGRSRLPGQEGHIHRGTKCGVPNTRKGGGRTSVDKNWALPTQVWGTDTGVKTTNQVSSATGGLAPEAHKRGNLGRPYMFARAPGLASMILLAVKEHIWSRQFIDIFSLLEMQGLDLTMVDKKEEVKRERNRISTERNFDNWLDAFRIMVCITVEKFPHYAKDLWLYESKIHNAQRQFVRDAWLDYKGCRLKCTG
ncbi:hypothetical protein NDU88_002194 [Pleurodeles waltl]|uniref:Uncharacterized protein n=1 Tax=Pleurodeles waltl TaxID=8319 RepID=A0AAV7LZU6_PLEWA|nr:hypothetical protein NDU88_002194 [Pleurodeles waltl]